VAFIFSSNLHPFFVKLYRSRITLCLILRQSCILLFSIVYCFTFFLCVCVPSHLCLSCDLFVSLMSLFMSCCILVCINVYSIFVALCPSLCLFSLHYVLISSHVLSSCLFFCLKEPILCLLAFVLRHLSFFYAS
jgi:hypothetical protein